MRREGGTIGAALRQAVDRHGDRVVLRDARGSMTFREMGALSDALAADLRRRGAGAGTAVVLAMPSGQSMWATFWALWKLGAVPVALADHPAAGLARILPLVAPSFVVAAQARLDKVRDGFRQAGLALPHLYNDGPADAPDSIYALPPSAVAECDHAPDAVASIVFSSGTTGLPKGIVHTHRSLIAAAASIWSLLGLQERDTVYSVHQLYHVWSQVAILLTGSFNGLTTFIEPFAYPETLTRLDGSGAVLFHAPPPVLSALGSHESAALRFSTLRTIITGGAPVNVAAVNRILSRNPGLTVRTGYGGSEYVIASMDPALSEPSTPESSGRPLSTVEVTILDPDASGTGEIAVRSPAMMEGYLNEPALTAQSFSDGRFLTGDVGRIAEDGRLLVSGRIKDIVIVNGENVVPAEVEAVANTHPDVQKSMAVGVPHPAAGQAIKLKVVLMGGRDGDFDAVAFLKHMRSVLPHNKVPRQIEVVDRIEENETGKAVRSR